LEASTLARIKLSVLTADISHNFFCATRPTTDTGQSAAPQLRNVIAASLQLSESRAFEVSGSASPYTPIATTNMSDIQQYLLDFDRNKKEATATAQRSATRMYEVPAGHLVGCGLIMDRTEEWRTEAYKPGH
jgi:hypothetical protein